MLYSNELRDHKDYMITLNTLLRKAVESAGVHPIHIDSVSNRNIQLIEQLSSQEQCQSFRAKMIRSYCLLVRKHNLKDYSLLTQKIITYVDTELCADLSLKALSERLSVNASYLSTLFKKEMGMSLTDFVNHRRISHAQKLLISTEMPIKSVALKCGIPDIYYFSRLFKRITGTTPKAYRNNTSSYEQYQELTSPFFRKSSVLRSALTTGCIRLNAKKRTAIRYCWYPNCGSYHIKRERETF